MSQIESKSQEIKVNDREGAFFVKGVGGFPKWKDGPWFVFVALSSVYSLLVLYFGITGLPADEVHRPFVLAFGLILCFFAFPSNIFDSGSKKEAALNIILILITISGCMWSYLTWIHIQENIFLTSRDILFGSILFIPVLEATRRTVGLPLVILGIVCLLYAYLGPYFPGVIAHRGYELERIVAVSSSGAEGIFGVPLAVTGAVISIFLLLGSFMTVTRGAEGFMNLASILTAGSSGGPAKVAVVGSGFMAMISGSAVANVATTGVVTIPAMKKLGYPPHIAGAIEAVASSGGQKTPPIMGAATFIMADFIGVPYIRVILCATIPALLHYVALFSQVNYMSLRMNIRPTLRSDAPKILSCIFNCIHIFAAVAVLVYLLLNKYSSELSCISAIIVLISVSFLRSSSRMNIRSFIEALVGAARLAAPMLAACGSAGLVLGILSLTGMGAKLSEAIEAYCYGSGSVALIFTMVVSLILGMGLPTIVCYLLLAFLVSPVLAKMGFPLLASHFFIFYYGVLSTLTPPLCMSSFTAAGIADAPMMKTGLTSVKLGTLLYIIPYGFMYNPELLFEGTGFNIAIHSAFAILGAWGLGIALEGFCYKKLNGILRVAFLFCSITLLFYINTPLVLVAVAVLASVYGYLRYSSLGNTETSYASS